MEQEPVEMMYDTEAEAKAFIEGLEFPDNDHINWEGPTKQGKKWVVTVEEFC